MHVLCREHIAASNTEFSLTVDDLSAISEMPKNLLALLSKNTYVAKMDMYSRNDQIELPLRTHSH